MNAELRLSPQSLSRLSAYNNADLGPHAQALWRDLRAAAAAGLPLAVVTLAAALIDVVAHEDAGPAGYLDGAAFSFSGNKAELSWLRRRRNGILHHEQPTDGLMGETDAARWLVADAERAVTTLLEYLANLDVGGMD
ncbi:hypothetical protein OAN83_01265 [Alphaproteobacteria bacterium]|nr:hypothetical protein [Alphaproteobacteria bacterium]